MPTFDAWRPSRLLARWRGQTPPADASVRPSEFSTDPLAETLRGARGLVLFDLDKTAIDANYAPTATGLERLQRAIHTLQTNGVLVGIHSDSPRETITQFGQLFGAQGPHVYEMGGVYVPASEAREETDVALNPAATAYFGRVNARLADSLRTFGQEHSIRIATDEDRNLDKREGRTYPDATQGVWLNPYRRHSIGLWAEVIDPATGRTYFDTRFREGKGVEELAQFDQRQTTLLTNVDQLVKQALESDPEAASIGELDYDRNAAYGVIIAKLAALSNKTAPIQLLLGRAGNGFTGQVFMIGDSPADFINDSRVTTLAVGNARDELKIQVAEQKRSYSFPTVSDGSFTDGVAEHLENIARNLGIQA
ncbi:MAG: hypothetical protein ACREGI_04520 [Candidatus Levyibacteriota bacterium]